jgi:hypothetical protein
LPIQDFLKNNIFHFQMTMTTGNNIFSSVSVETHPLKSLTENWHNSIRVFLVVLILAGLQLLLTMQLRIRYEPVAENTQHVAERIDPSLFSSMSFGQLPAAIDWVFLKCLQDPTLEHVKKGEHLQVYYDLDVLTDLDERFFAMYTVGANLLSVVHDDGAGAVSLLLKAEKFRLNELSKYPDSFRRGYWDQEWQIPLLLAYNYLFELDDLPRAAASYQEASYFPEAPEYLRGLAKEFQSAGGMYQVGLRLLKFMIRSQKDPIAKEKLEQKMVSLEVLQFLFNVNQQFQAFLVSKKYSSQYLGSDSVRLRLWRDFLVESATSDIDPWNGTLSLNSDGKVVSTTEHQKVFGME